MESSNHATYNKKKALAGLIYAPSTIKCCFFFNQYPKKRTDISLLVGQSFSQLNIISLLSKHCLITRRPGVFTRFLPAESRRAPLIPFYDTSLTCSVVCRGLLCIQPIIIHYPPCKQDVLQIQILKNNNNKKQLACACVVPACRSTC